MRSAGPGFADLRGLYQFDNRGAWVDIGGPKHQAVTLRAYGKIGVEHMALQFMVPRWPERRQQIERFAREVMPALRNR